MYVMSAPTMENESLQHSPCIPIKVYLAMTMFWPPVTHKFRLAPEAPRVSRLLTVLPFGFWEQSTHRLLLPFFLQAAPPAKSHTRVHLFFNWFSFYVLFLLSLYSNLSRPSLLLSLSCLCSSINSNTSHPISKNAWIDCLSGLVLVKTCYLMTAIHRPHHLSCKTCQ